MKCVIGTAEFKCIHRRFSYNIRTLSHYYCELLYLYLNRAKRPVKKMILISFRCSVDIHHHMYRRLQYFNNLQCSVVLYHVSSITVLFHSTTFIISSSKINSKIKLYPYCCMPNNYTYFPNTL